MDKPLRLTESETLEQAAARGVRPRRRPSSDQYLTGPQADAILAMQLQRLTGLEIEKLAEEYAEL